MKGHSRAELASGASQPDVRPPISGVNRYEITSPSLRQEKENSAWTFWEKNEYVQFRLFDPISATFPLRISLIKCDLQEIIAQL
jgi:hypothetical protein